MSRFVYADASALAKVFWRESGSKIVLGVVKKLLESAKGEGFQTAS